ncbi:type VII secretion protein EccB [Actinoallomurus bryophytorum]|uniref:Type VII secretion protein EccB n=1 Tax=Actinoallomurus bryophytorum TaxID=1490222 RepID=A0A543CH65_9ACTN|nr:type VII secretion protein EccB [Actinoallomurus bryophytorum]TQL96421.1 type VII secretion protein EccB [Actinoallomurus bryophytorum]
MHNRRDQVHAHGFMVGRLVSALMRAEPDMAVPPMRRSWSGLIIGALIAALAVAGFAVFAIVSPGGATAWRKPGTLILDKQTGTRYVLAAGQLRPVLNYASARLLLGSKLTVDSVATKSLQDVPRGGPVGIIGAPDALPHGGRESAPWLACASSTGAKPALTLAIGADPAEQPMTPNQAVLVRTTDGTTYLVTGGRRLRVTAPWVTRALGFSDGAAIGVRDAWIDTLPAGPDLPPPATPEVGKNAPDLDGHPATVGEVFVVRGAGTDQRLYLQTTGGLQPMTQTAAALALSDPKTATAYPGGTVGTRDLSPAAVAASQILPTPGWMAQLPPAPPTLDAVTGGRMPCVRSVPGANRIDTSMVTVPAVPVTAANAVSATTAAAGTATAADPAGNRIADQVVIAPKAGLLARTLPAPGVPGEGLYLVTEDGAKFPVANDAAATALGYSTATATAVPADLLALLPTGPVLRTLGSGGG